MKPTLKPPGTKRLKLQCDILVSTVAVKFNLRRYIWAAETFQARVDGDGDGDGDGAGASLAAAGRVDWLHLTQDAATSNAAKLPQSSVGGKLPQSSVGGKVPQSSVGGAGAVGESAGGKARKGAG
jgi:hypothetical protein